MTENNRKGVKLWILITFSVFAFIIGTGFYRELTAGDDETYEGLKIFSDVIEEIERNYVDTVDTKELIEEAIKGMVNSLDPHSQFLPPDVYEEFQTGTKGEFDGIGIVISMPEDVLTVISPIEGTPAYKAGIKPGDIIAKVDGEPTKTMEMWEAVKKMRGPRGTSVVITVVREGVDEPMDFKLIRDIIPIESVRHVSVKPGYGYVWITNFQDKSTDELKKALEELESDETPLKGLILDFRNNPGGLLDQAISITDMFLEEGTILTVKGRLEQQQSIYQARKREVKRDYPIILLINSGSASASEIVAGALQDNNRALIVGTTSFGKGSVQTVRPLRDGSGLKYTMARYYTPSGRSIQAKGIEPDIVIEYKAPDDSGDTADTRYLKEKDLKNHLEAENQNDEADSKEEEPVPDTTEEYGSISREMLLLDNQVMYALDLLISYEILKNADNSIGAQETGQ